MEKNNQRLTFKVNVDNVIDLITNSSSELFIIENNTTKETLAEMLNVALEGITKVRLDDIEERFVRSSNSPYEDQWRIDNFFEEFKLPGNAIEEIKQKYFATPNFYGISFDRDWVYNMSNEGKDVRSILISLGFELESSDYG